MTSLVATKAVSRRQRVNVVGVASSTCTVETTNDHFPTFNPQRDLQIGHFLALTVERKEVRAGVPFFVGKVMEFGQW